MRKLLNIAVMVFAVFTFWDVKAVDSISFDSNVKGTIDPDSYLITTVGSIDIEVDNIGSDTFSIYKVLNAFYNPTTNVITYEFTSNFKDFLTSTTAYKNLTIEDYYNLTSGDITSGSTQTNSTLDKLASAYAVYIRKNSIASDGILDVAVSVENGAYLILPNATTKIYAVMIANVVYKPGANNEWFLSNPVIVPKVTDVSIAKAIDSPNILEKLYGFNDIFSYYLTTTFPRYPTNATNMVYTITDTMDVGLSFIGLNDITITAGETLTNTNGTFKDSSGNTVATATIAGQKLTIVFDSNYVYSTSIIVLYKAKLNENAVLGGNGNLNRATLTYSNDPYGTSTTTELCSTSVFTHGVKVKVIDKDESSFIPGFVFDVYDNISDTKIGTITTGEDGIGILKGTGAYDYKIVNVKAASGYDLIDYSTTKINMDDTYASFDIYISKSPSLPFTGGIGTIIYTVIGLIVIVGSVALFYVYRKRQDRELS